MKILAIEATGNDCSVAICYGEKLAQRTVAAPQKQGELLLPMIDEILQELHLTGSDLDIIAFDCGPGSFTGVRLTTAVAQGLGFGWGKLLMPISSLQALAYKIYCQEQRVTPILVAIDARKQEVYAGAYQFSSHGMLVTYPEQVIAPSLLPVEDIVLSMVPQAQDLLVFAQYCLNNGLKPVRPEEVHPVYLRNKVTD